MFDWIRKYLEKDMESFSHSDEFSVFQYSKGPCEFFIIAKTREKADELNQKYINGSYCDVSEVKEGLTIQSMSNVPKPEVKE